jgi:hypothetical protein
MNSGLCRKEREMETPRDYNMPAFERNKAYVFTRIRGSTRHIGEKDGEIRFVFDRGVVGSTYMAMFHHERAKWRETFTEPQLRDYEITKR